MLSDAELDDIEYELFLGNRKNVLRLVPELRAARKQRDEAVKLLRKWSVRFPHLWLTLGEVTNDFLVALDKGSA